MYKKIAILILISTILAVLPILIPPQTPAYAEEPEPECWAVIVGVSDYKRLDDISGNANSAEELFQLLSPAWGEEHIKLLLDSEATKANVREAIDWLASNKDANDTVLFYFAGHGETRKAQIAPYNAYYAKTWITSSELSGWLRALDSERIVIILDTCYAGRFETSLSDSGRVVLMSSRADEESWVSQWEYDDEWYNIFTYFLLEALSEFDYADDNWDYELSAEELFRYAEHEVVFVTEDWKQPIQHPVLSDQYPGELSLLVQFIFNTEPELPSGIDILILDNEEYSSAPFELIWAPGSTHDITILSVVDTGIGTRYVFTSWNNGDTSLARTISHGGEYIANYNTQHQLLIESAYGEPEGQGWYDASSTAAISVTFIIEKPTTRHIFAGWSGDYSGDNTTASITMDSPKLITANWRTEHLLTIKSAYGEPEGQGWYESGSTVAISAASIEGRIIRHIFTGWSGDYSGDNTTASITMDSPKLITANWRTDYTRFYIFIAGVVVAAIVIGLRIRRRRKVM